MAIRVLARFTVELCIDNILFVAASLGMTKAQIAALWESLPDAYEIADTINLQVRNHLGTAGPAVYAVVLDG